MNRMTFRRPQSAAAPASAAMVVVLAVSCSPGVASDQSETVAATQAYLRDAFDGGVGNLVADTSTDDFIQARMDATVQLVGRGCSGTLISPRLVVTAAHCIDDNGTNISAVRFDERKDQGSTVAVVGCYMQPHYSDLACRLDGSCPSVPAPTANTPEHEPCYLNTQGALVRARHDMAALVLAERVELNRAGTVPVIPTRPDYTRVDEEEYINFVAYGGDPTGLNVRSRALDIPVEGYHDGSNVWLEGTMFVGGDWFVNGDSGGTVARGFVNLDPIFGYHFVGVISGSPQNNDCPACDMDLYNRSHIAPASHSGNQAFLESLLTDPVDLPGTFDAPLYFGEWDLPLRGEADRATSAYDTLRPLDPDGDGLVAAHDNCPGVFNPEQRDGGSTINGVDVALDGVADFADCLVAPMMGIMM